MKFPSSSSNGLLALAVAPALLTTTLAANTAYHCPPLGPVFPVPQNPSKNPAVQKATDALETVIDQITSDFKFSALSVGVKSIHEDGVLFTKSYSPPVTDPRGVSTVDASTVFRIGSGSKLFTMLGVLKLPGVSLDDPITKYIPELKPMAAQTGETDGFPVVSWDDITIGALASHLAGIGVDFATDLDNFPEPWTELGLPPANPALNLNCAGLLGLRPCNRTDFFNLFGHHHPVFAPFTSPVYSNIGYALLAFVIENVSNTTYDAFMHKEVLDPLGLTNTSTSKPPVNDSLGFIPNGDIWWGSVLGFEDPVGSYYSNVYDLLTFASAILDNKLLSPVQTRKWMKPATSTSDTGFQLGNVWEIYRSDNLTSDGRFIEIYTKSGDLGNYHSQTILIPDYDVVATVLVAGNETSDAVSQKVLSEIVTTLLPAFETAGREESVLNFAGTYQDNSTNSSLVLTIDDGPGLLVQSWIEHGVDIQGHYASFNALSSKPLSNPVSIRIYPTNLVSSSQQSWRAIVETTTPAVRQAQDAAVFWARSSCVAWATLDRTTYQLRSLDEFVFNVCNQTASSITPRIFQTKLQRK